MIRYIQIPQAPGLDYLAFKDDYLDTVGEKIQDSTLENSQGTHYLVGSSRLTEEQAVELESRHPGVTTTSVWPVGWTAKEEQT